MMEREREVREMEWLGEKGEEKDKGEERNLQFSLQHKENVHQIDVAITRKTSKAQNAVLADLLTEHAAAASTAAVLHFVQGGNA